MRDESDPRLPVAHLRLERLDVLRFDVRRVGDDEIECVMAKAFGQVVLDQPDAAVDPEQLEILARERQGVLGGVDCGHPGPWMLVDDCERDRPGPGTDVEHGRLPDPVEVLERPLDDDLRLRPRD